MTEEAGDDDFGDVGSVGTAAITQPHHHNSDPESKGCVFS